MTATIDLTYLHKVSNGNKVFELEILRSLISEIDQKAENLRESILTDQRKTVRLHAHSLKNLCGILGANNLKELFYALEIASVESAYVRLYEQYLKSEEAWQENRPSVLALVTQYETSIANQTVVVT